MELSKMTKLDLLELRSKINQEIKVYENRNKTKVYAVFIDFIGTEYFLKRENAIIHLKECIEGELVFDGNEMRCGETYLNDSEIELNCSDYYEK